MCYCKVQFSVNVNKMYPKRKKNADRGTRTNTSGLQRLLLQHHNTLSYNPLRQTPVLSHHPLFAAEIASHMPRKIKEL
jgi:hypothetical protein